MFHADSTCPTCRVTLLWNHAAEPRTTASHTHSADEIIHVTKGEIQAGRLNVKAGMAVAVAAGVRYGFRSSGYEFVNYRQNASYRSKHGQPPLLEVADPTLVEEWAAAHPS